MKTKGENVKTLENNLRSYGTDKLFIIVKTKLQKKHLKYVYENRV